MRASALRAGFPTVGPVERALAVRSLPLFRTLRAQEVSILAQLLREYAAPRGRELQVAGERVDSVFLLTDGRVRHHRTGGPANSLEAPDAIGLVELLAGEPARVTTTAETGVSALVIDRTALLDVLEDQFSLVLHLRTALGREIAAREAQLGCYALPPAGPARPLDPPASAALDVVECLLWLQQLPELRALGVAVLAALLRDQTAVQLQAGEPLFEAGAEATRFVVLVTGEAACTPADAQAAFCAGPGDVLGRGAVLSGLAHSYSAVTESPGLAIAIDAQAFWDLAEDHFHVALAALSMSARRLLWLDELGTRRTAQPSSASAPANRETQ